MRRKTLDPACPGFAPRIGAAVEPACPQVGSNNDQRRQHRPGDTPAPGSADGSDELRCRAGARRLDRGSSITAALAVAVLLITYLAGCRAGGDTARGTAERFLDEHYVRIDLGAAKAYTVGVARQKVEEEQHLVGDQQIDASTRRPSVSYEMLEERTESADRISFVYQGKVRFDDGDTTKLRWLISTRREPDGTWKVSNWQEFP
jgi:hypothetical protein